MIDYCKLKLVRKGFGFCAVKYHRLLSGPIKWSSKAVFIYSPRAFKPAHIHKFSFTEKITTQGAMCTQSTVITNTCERRSSVNIKNHEWIWICISLLASLSTKTGNWTKFSVQLPASHLLLLLNFIKEFALPKDDKLFLPIAFHRTGPTTTKAHPNYVNELNDIRNVSSSFCAPFSVPS